MDSAMTADGARHALSLQVYEALWQYSSDLLSIIDERGVLRYASPSYERTLGYSPAEIQGTSSLTRIHPDDVDLVRQALLDAGREPRATVRVRFRYQRKDGVYRVLDVVGANHLNDPVVRGFVVNARDVTEWVEAEEQRRRTEEELERRVEERTRELATLLEVSHHVVSTLELEPLLRVIFDQLAAVVEYTDSSVFALEDGIVRIIGNRGPMTDYICGMTFPIEPGGLVEAVGVRGETVLIDDTTGDHPDAERYRAAVGSDAGRLDTHSWLGVPMRAGGRTIGALSVSHQKPGYYTEHHAALVQAFGEQAALAIENARLYDEAQRGAALQERQRLARELHDSVSQALYGIVLGARTARALFAQSPQRAGEPLDYVLGQAEAALADMRALIFELRPEALENEGLVTALEKRVTASASRHGLRAETHFGDEPDIPFQTKEALYRIAQEALHNVVKHARATAIEVELRLDEAAIVLRIQDNGRGFDPAGPYPGHLGLKSMQERVIRLGGTLQITSAPGDGTAVCVTVPVDTVGS